VNLAGITGVLLPIRDHYIEIYKDVFSVNVLGVFNCMAAELKHMRSADPDTKTPGGSIVNAGSIAGLVGKANTSVYCASKHAVHGLTKAAAIEEAKTSGIRINAIAP